MEAYWVPSYLRIRSKNKGTTCTVEDCDRPGYCKTYCQMHYKRLWRSGTLEARKYEKKVK